MPSSIATPGPIDYVVRLFPRESANVRRLYLADTEFRSICDDYALARDSLARLTSRRPQGAGQTIAEIEEYRRVIADLETELDRYVVLVVARQRGPSS